MSSFFTIRSLIGLFQIAIAAVAGAAAAGYINLDPQLLAAILAVQNVLTGGHRAATPQSGNGG